MKFQWKGVFPALTTKFTPELNLDDAMFLHNLKHQTEAGVHGIILGGTLGEASVLSEDEKKHLVQLTVSALNGSLPVVLNIAEGATREAIARAESAGIWGASGLMVLPPMRYKADDNELFAYFSAIASSTDLPIMIYNNPVDYKNEVNIRVFDQLLNKHENIAAVKESTRDVSNVTRLKTAFGDRLSVLCGVDTLAMESLVLGADGWVAGLVCAFPQETVAIYRLCEAGKFNEAREIYRWFLPLLELDIHPKLVQYIKLAETYCGLGSEEVRPPRLRLHGEERARVEAIITSGIQNRPNLKQYL
ncbi:MAG: dihydrodipicolinate synthase family protein [Saprospiraceae bacterium]|nr:dihydrodipicolinate synthase family protein [Saprospiraceae bacterium]